MTLPCINMCVPVPAESKSEDTSRKLPTMWNVLDADIVNTEFEGVCHINLNLVNLIFHLSNFVHEKF